MFLNPFYYTLQQAFYFSLAGITIDLFSLFLFTSLHFILCFTTDIVSNVRKSKPIDSFSNSLFEPKLMTIARKRDCKFFRE